LHSLDGVDLEGVLRFFALPTRRAARGSAFPAGAKESQRSGVEGKSAMGRDLQTGVIQEKSDLKQKDV